MQSAKFKFILAGFMLGTSVWAGTNLAPISVKGFRDSAHHWRHIRDSSRFIQVQPNQPSYEPEQVRETAANILLFQRANGGWPKDYDMTAVLTPEQAATVKATHNDQDTSYDNHNLHAQVDYLARAYSEAAEPAWKEACVRGLDFMFASQYPNGGIPQRFPKPKDFHAYITFNDGVMIGVMDVLEDIVEEQAQWKWLDAERRARARQAVQLGVGCILKCQITMDGQLTGWCQQHDQRTYQAASGRTFELASCCPEDTTKIAKFLTRVKPATPELVRAVESAAAWLAKVKLSGIKVKKVKAPAEVFERHTADFDTVVTADAQAKPIWARHYELGTNRPIFAGRDGVKKYALAEIERERRTGTPWYGDWPAKFLEKDYPAWKSTVKSN